MDIQIFQINSDRDDQNVKFMGLHYLSKNASDPLINSSSYDRVFSGSVQANNLEGIYRIFNCDHPPEHTGHSLSVSDIVQVVSGSSTVEPGFYFCDSIGFPKIDFDAEKAHCNKLIRGVLLEPGKEARIAEVDASLPSYQHLVGGLIECVYPFEDHALILCNEEGKLQRLPVNRALRDEEKTIDMDYSTMCAMFRSVERSGSGTHATGYVVFSPESFTEEYSLESRTYKISSNNKAFQPNMSGYSIFASNLDGSDRMCRLEAYMSNEKGGKDGWKIERCYMKEPGAILDVLVGNVFICGDKDGEFMSLSDDQINHYLEAFRYPEQLFMIDGELQAIPYDPKGRTSALHDLVSNATQKHSNEKKQDQPPREPGAPER